MAISEYYIRQPDSEEARGPYDLGRIGDLIEAGKADVTTLYFDEEREDWVPLADNPDFREVLFPEKQRLGLRAKEITDSINEEEDKNVSITVDQMLAAAEGKTDETRTHANREEFKGAIAGFGLVAMASAFLLMAIHGLVPRAEELQKLIDESDYASLIASPFVLLGLVDGFLALCCFLSATEIYPFVRFRAMLGAGFMGYLAWVVADWIGMGVYVASSLAIYVLSLTVNTVAVVFFSILAVGGIGYLTFLELFS